MRKPSTRFTLPRLHLNSLGVRLRLGLVVSLSIIALLAVGLGGWFGISRVSSATARCCHQNCSQRACACRVDSCQLGLDLSPTNFCRGDWLRCDHTILITVSVCYSEKATLPNARDPFRFDFALKKIARFDIFNFVHSYIPLSVTP